MENRETISAFTATLPERAHIMVLAVESILPQVDRVQVVLNNFDHTPDFLNHEKITVIHSDNRLEDGSRFIGIENAPPGFTLVFDDDIIYPPDYVQTLISKAKDRAVMVTPMGKILFSRPVRSYYGDIVKSYRTFERVKKDAEVEVPGACGILWDNRIVNVSEADMLIPNSDLCLAKVCRDNEYKPIVIAHDAEWLKNIWPQAKGAPSIYGKYRRNDNILTEFVNKHL